MDEQAGSPATNADNNSQRNGDEVRDPQMSDGIFFSVFSKSNSQNILPVYVMEGGGGGRFLPEPSKKTHLFFFLIFAEAPAWQLDQGEEEEEADEGLQRTQSPPDGLRPLHERPAGAAAGGASRRALPRDHQDAGQRVEQAAPRGQAGGGGVVEGSALSALLIKIACKKISFHPCC